MAANQLLGEHIGRPFARYVSLNILSMLGLSCYILADTFFIANGVGPDGLTALNLVLPAFTLLSGTGILLGMGAGTRFAIYKGENKEHKANAVYTHAMVTGAVLGVLYTLIGLFFAEDIARLLGADSIILPISSGYLRTLMLYSCAFVLNNILICFIRNDHAPNLAMAAMLTASLSNVVLDYVFVFPLGLGMFGAALATGISPILSMIVLTLHFIRRKSSFRLTKCCPDYRTVGKIFALGFPSFVTEMSNGIVIIILNFVILGLAGNTGVAAYGIVANLGLVAVSVFTGEAQGIQPLISYNYGAGIFRNIRKTYRMALITALCLGVVLYLCGSLFSEPVVALFNRDGDPKLAAYAIDGLRIYFTAFLIMGINIVSVSYFSSIAMPAKSFILSMLRGFAAVIPFALLLPLFLGLNGAWLSVPSAELVTLALSILLAVKYRIKAQKPSKAEI